MRSPCRTRARGPGRGRRPGGVDDPHVARALVGVEVAAVQGRLVRIASDIAAHDRAAEVVIVLGDRQDEPVLAAAVGPVAVPAFHHVPAEVGGRRDGIRRPDHVHLLPGVLADVADPQVACRPIEREAPGVAEAVGADLGPGARIVGERVVRRDGVGRSGAVGGSRPDAEELAQERRPALAVAERVAARAAVAGGDVQVAVGPEVDVAAVVVRERLVDLEEDPLAAGVGLVRCRRRDAERRHHGVPVEVGVVHEQPRVGREVRGEGQPEQAALAARQDPLADVEERWIDQQPVPDDPDPARLLDDEQATAAVAGIDRGQRAVEPADDGLEADAQLRRVEGTGGRAGGRGRGRA